MTAIITLSVLFAVLATGYNAHIFLLYKSARGGDVEETKYHNKMVHRVGWIMRLGVFAGIFWIGRLLELSWEDLVFASMIYAFIAWAFYDWGYNMAHGHSPFYSGGKNTSSTIDRWIGKYHIDDWLKGLLLLATVFYYELNLFSLTTANIIGYVAFLLPIYLAWRIRKKREDV